MAHTRSQAGMDALPLLLSDESEESEEDVLLTLLWHVVYTQECLTRSVALLKDGHKHLYHAHERLSQTQHHRAFFDA
jgi:hypothetical protein